MTMWLWRHELQGGVLYLFRNLHVVFNVRVYVKDGMVTYIFRFGNCRLMNKYKLPFQSQQILWIDCGLIAYTFLQYFARCLLTSFVTIRCDRKRQ